MVAHAIETFGRLDYAVNNAGIEGQLAGPSDLEIRPLWESEDFGPEIAAQENELRAKIAKGAK